MSHHTNFKKSITLLLSNGEPKLASFDRVISTFMFTNNCSNTRNKYYAID